jgi:predicted 3-demethylubiquinone-9 3-methyltransferase (glyoxalase superfamily)
VPTITPSLWFDTEGEEAAKYYISIFPNSEIRNVSYYNDAGPRPAGTVLTVDFVLDGQPFNALNGGPQFEFTEAVSLMIDCADQAEIDYYWDKLSEGGEEGQCGWLKDRFGLSWQIAPMTAMGDFLTDPDEARATRVMQAMMGMKKIDLAALRAAADGG